MSMRARARMDNPPSWYDVLSFVSVVSAMAGWPAD